MLLRMSMLVPYSTFDLCLFEVSVVSQYSFGHDDNLLEDIERASTLRDHLSRLLLGVKFNQHFPWIVDGLDMLPIALGKFIMPPGVLDMIDFTTVNDRQLPSITH